MIKDIEKFRKIYLKKYLLSYQQVCEILSELCRNYQGKIKCELIGKSSFDYSINSYIIGRGKKHVLLIGATHSNEIVTTYFLLDFMITLLWNIENEINDKYTFHFIPILNVEGYDITTSNIMTNFKTYSVEEIERLASKYLEAYNLDDMFAKQGIKKPKNFYHILKASLSNIKNKEARASVERILLATSLNENVLNIWSANALGVDQNSNSIHRFCEIKKLRNKQQFANLRYNDIPVTLPSPMSYPGCFPFDRSPENLSLYRYIMRLYQMNRNKNSGEELICIFSYHATGGQLFSIPNVCNQSREKIKEYQKLFRIYADMTGYQLMEDKNQYGVMDFYRCSLNQVIVFTVELSKKNANPIGPFSNISDLEKEISDNKEAVLKVIESRRKIY